jgi:hypothetical protein
MMRRNFIYGLLLMILFGGALGCGKSDPEPQEGVNPFEERQKGMKDSAKDRGPMFPKGVKPGAK